MSSSNNDESRMTKRRKFDGDQESVPATPTSFRNRTAASPEMTSMQILQRLGLTPVQLQLIENLIRNKDKGGSGVHQPGEAVTPVAMTMAAASATPQSQRRKRKAYSGAASTPFSLSHEVNKVSYANHRYQNEQVQLEYIRSEWKRQNEVTKTHETAIHKLKVEDVVLDIDDKKLRQKEEELTRSLSAVRVKREEIDAKRRGIGWAIEFEEDIMADAELRSIELENEYGLQKIRTHRFEHMYKKSKNLEAYSIALEDCSQEELRELFEIKHPDHIAFCHIYEMVETFGILQSGGYCLPTEWVERFLQWKERDWEKASVGTEDETGKAARMKWMKHKLAEIFGVTVPSNNWLDDKGCGIRHLPRDYK